MPRTIVLLALFLALAPGLPRSAAADLDAVPEWETVAEVETIQVLTDQDDGTVRDTTVWLAVVDGQGYIRTGGSSWGESLVVNPLLRVRIGADEYALQVVFVEDDDLRARVTETFREKYGWSDALISIVRGSRPKIMRLTAR